MENVIYALIENNLVTNLIYLFPQATEDFPNAVPTEGRSIDIGDSYIDGKFYHDGEEVLTPEEEYEQVISIIVTGE